jgi:H+/Cl- antiporter ClcA
MATPVEERNQILSLIQSGILTAEQAAQLLDDLAVEPVQPEGPRKHRFVRVRVTDLTAHRQKVNVTVPVGLISVGLRLATRLAPQVRGSALEDLMRAMEGGSTGRLLDLQDLEEGERVEIFAE